MNYLVGILDAYPGLQNAAITDQIIERQLVASKLHMYRWNPLERHKVLKKEKLSLGSADYFWWLRVAGWASHFVLTHLSSSQDAKQFYTEIYPYIKTTNESLAKVRLLGVVELASAANELAEQVALMTKALPKPVNEKTWSSYMSKFEHLERRFSSVVLSWIR